MLLNIVCLALFALMVIVVIKAVSAHQDGVVWEFDRVTDTPTKTRTVMAWKVWAAVLAALYTLYLVFTFIDAF